MAPYLEPVVDGNEAGGQMRRHAFEAGAASDCAATKAPSKKARATRAGSLAFWLSGRMPNAIAPASLVQAVHFSGLVDAAGLRG
jgi:hypothetical protein